MPGTYYTPEVLANLREKANMESIHKLQGSLDSVTAMLCKLCATMEKENTAWAMPPEIRTWWQKHQEQDRVAKAQNRHRLALRSFEGIQKTIMDIRKLGGEPREALTKAHADANHELAAAEEAVGISSYKR